MSRRVSEAREREAAHPTREGVVVNSARRRRLVQPRALVRGVLVRAQQALAVLGLRVVAAVAANSTRREEVDCRALAIRQLLARRALPLDSVVAEQAAAAQLLRKLLARLCLVVLARTELAYRACLADGVLRGGAAHCRGHVLHERVAQRALVACPIA